MKNCPACGTSKPVHETRDLPYPYKGRTTIIPSVIGHHCAHCGEVALDPEAADEFGDLLEAFQRKVNREIVDPAFILAVRKKARA